MGIVSIFIKFKRRNIYQVMIELKGITKNYYLNKTNIINVLKGIDIKFRQNEFVSILGPSGCGKTTLLNIIGGLDVCDDGAIFVDGVSTKEYDASDWDNYRNKKIGFVFQSYNLIPHLNVLGNVCMPLVLAGQKKSECAPKAIEALKLVGLEEQIYKKPLQLSGGQMQRVAIARALVTDPEIILADEPTGALDNESSVQVMALLKEVAKNRLVVMVTHNNQLADEYSTRIINLSGGVVSGDSNPFDGTEEQTENIIQKSEIDEQEAEIIKCDDEEKPLFAEIQTESETGVDCANKQKEKEDKLLEETPKKKEKKSHLSFRMAANLSAKTLISKKVRTALTAFAGSIGIIGIVLVLAFSSGVNAYISNLEKGALSLYPLTVEKTSFNVSSLISNFMTAGGNGEREEYPNTEDIFVNKVLGNVIADVLGSLIESKNDLGDFKNYIENNFDDTLGYVKYNYGLKINVYAKDPLQTDKFMKVEPFMEVMDNAMGQTGMTLPDSMMGMIDTYAGQISAWSEMINNQDLLNSQYEIVGNGKWPKNEVYKENGQWYTDIVMVLDNTNSINDYELLLLGLKSESELGEALKPNGNFSQSTYKVSDIIGMEYNILTGSDYFNKDDSDKWTKTETTVQDADYVSSHTAVTARISAVVRPRKGAAGTSISTKLAYTEALTKHLVEHTEQSPVAQAQKEAFENGKLSIISGSKMTENQYKKFMQEEVGIVDYTTPISVNIYANSFEAKETIKAFINQYNEETDSDLEATDGLQTLISFVNTMSDAITKVLVGFCAISLIVSSIMIAVIIYTSVLERRKEVGILRSIGARKSDITVIFMTESGMLGLLSGLIGVFVAWIITIPVNVVLESALGIANLALVYWWHVVMMVMISFALSIIAGVVPAFIGAKQDPAVALRTE